MRMSTVVSKAGLLALAICLYAALPAHTSAQVVINEFLYDASGADTDREYIELLNIGSAPVDLSQWKINDGSNHALNVPPKNGGTGSITLQPGGYMLLVDNATDFLAAHAGISGTVIDTVLSLGNTSVTVVLLDESGAVADSVAYSKDQGAAGDGNSLQRIGEQWVAANPTMNTANTTASAPLAGDSSGSGNPTSTPSAGTNTAPSAHAPVSSYVAPPEPQVFADAGSDRIVIVGADVEFRGRAYNRKKEDVGTVRFFWNFGEGTTREGSVVLHHFEYPGKYAVVLHVAKDMNAVSDRIVVVAEPAKLAFAVNPDSSVTIENMADRDLDLSRWVIRSFGRDFLLPEESMILSGASMRIAQKTFGFPVGPQTELLYPNGTRALLAGESTLTLPQAAAPPQAPVSQSMQVAEESDVVSESSETVLDVHDAADVPAEGDDPVALSDEITPSSATTSSQVAAVANASHTLYWWLGTLALATIAGGCVMVVRRMKKNEWDIEEAA